MKRVLPALGLVLLTSLALAAAASASTMTTAGHNLKMSSSKLEFKIGSVSINCQKFEATGVIGAPSPDSAELSNPLIQGSEGATCSTVGMSGATFTVVTSSEGANVWTLKENSVTSGSLIAPILKGGAGFKFVMTGGGCELLKKEGAITGTWANGNKFGTPSTLSMANSPFFIAANVSSGCPTALKNEITKENGTMKLTATFTVTDPVGTWLPVLFT